MNSVKLGRFMLVAAVMMVMAGCGRFNATGTSKLKYVSDTTGRSDIIEAKDTYNVIYDDLKRNKDLGPGRFEDNTLTIVPFTRAMMIIRNINAYKQYIFKNKLENDAKARSEEAEITTKAIQKDYEKYVANRTCFNFHLRNIDHFSSNNLTYWYGTLIVNNVSYPLAFDQDTIDTVSMPGYRTIERYYGSYLISSNSYPVTIKDTIAAMCANTKIDFTQEFSVVIEPRFDKDHQESYTFKWYKPSS